MLEIKNGGLDQCGAEPFEQQQFGTAGVEWVNMTNGQKNFLVALVNRKSDVGLTLPNSSGSMRYTHIME